MVARYIIRRLAWTVVVLVFITVLTFALFRVIPADPAAFAAGPGATHETVEAARQKLGLDRPLPVQYWQYVTGLIKLDFGTSIITRRPVAEDLKLYLPATFELALISFVLYLFIAISFGVLAAVRSGGLVDSLIRVISMIGTGAPVFWLAMILQLIFYAELGMLPLGGRLGLLDIPPATVTGFYTIDSVLAGDFGRLRTVIIHLILPVTAVILSLLAVGLRLTRASVARELAQPYVRTARAKGISERKIIARHVLRNALNPIITMSAIQFGQLLAWIILVETIFRWPGIGLYAYSSFQGLDYVPIMSLTVVISFFFLMSNLISDLLYPFFDPRIRYE